MCSAMWFMQDIQMPDHGASALGLPQRRVPFSQLHQFIWWATASLSSEIKIDGNMLFSLSVVSNSATPWTAACQVSLSFTISWSLLKLMSIQSAMLSDHLILCHLLLLLPSIFPSIRVFSSESDVCISWSKYWSFSNMMATWVIPRQDVRDWATGN